MSIFDGLDSLGLSNLDKLELYEEKKNRIEKPQEEVVKEAKLETEMNMLFAKSYVCPVCDSSFKSLTVKSGRTRVVSTDMDLRPRFDGIEPLKYEPVVCDKCGFAALSRYFGALASVQKKMIKESICANYKPKTYDNPLFTYEEAIERYKLSLANTVVKHGRASEKAYTCLKAGWLVRSYLDILEQQDNKDDKLIVDMKALEKEFLSNAYEGYNTAFTEEKFPISGMDEQTIDYLLAALAVNLGHYDEGSRLISKLLTSKNASSRMKDKARELKDYLIDILKNSVK